MSGIKNIYDVLTSLRVSCDEVEYGYGSVKNKGVPSSRDILGTFQEDEGTTIIAAKNYFERNLIAHEGPFAKLTIEVHTSLELVGLTAALSTTLTNHGIPANVVAGYFHDYIFVPYELRQKAIDAINQLRVGSSTI